MVIADITGNNPNVLHEVGIAVEALGPQRVVLITQSSHVPHDFSSLSSTVYIQTSAGLTALQAELTSRLSEALLSIGDKNGANQALTFISAKSSDYADAQLVHDFLKKHGILSFMSDESLPQRGSSDYRKTIDQALDEAKHLVVVTEVQRQMWNLLGWKPNGAFILTKNDLDERLET